MEVRSSLMVQVTSIMDVVNVELYRYFLSISVNKFKEIILLLGTWAVKE